MISRILKAITDKIGAHEAHEAALLSVARQFAIELHLATCLHDHNPEMMKQIVEIAGQALKASDQNHLRGMKNALAKIKEWTR